MSKRKLLLADDSITIQKVVNLTFADEGFEVISASDGDAAMKKFVEHMPDLVLADVNMPGLDGYRMCEMIKQDDETKQIPVILLVGSFEPFDELEANRVGANDYLTKPFQSIRQLVSKVSDLLDASQKTAAATNDYAVSTGEPDAAIAAASSSEMHFPGTGDFSRTAASSERFDDAGMDDEMIETTQISGFPSEESRELVSDQAGQGNFSDQSAEQSDQFEQANQFEQTQQFQQTEQFGQTDQFEKTGESNSAAFDNAQTEETEAPRPQTWSEEELWVINSPDLNNEVAETSYEPSSGETSQFEETYKSDESIGESIAESGETETYEIAPPATSLDETTEDDNFAAGETAREVPQPETASALSFDERDLLELPPLENADAADSPVDQATEQDERATKSVAETIQISNLSPEMIEAIAQKIAEKISDRTIRQIASEVVPQVTAQIIKKIGEEEPEE